NGMVTTAVGTSDDTVNEISMQADGKILVIGRFNNGSNTDIALVRYNTNGSLDTSFGSGGKVTTSVTAGSDVGSAVVVQADGKIVVAGNGSNGIDNDFALVRYNSDGTLDTRLNLSSTLDGNVSFTENGSPVFLDSNIRIFYTELSVSNFSGATLTLTRNSGANSQDLFSATGTLATLTQGGNLTIGGTTIGTVTTNSSGTLVLTFNSSATNTLVNSAMQQIAYANSSEAPPTNVQIDWTFSDGNSGTQGTGGALTATGSVTVHISSVNDAPTITSGYTHALTGTNEDTTSSGTLASAILSGASWADVDSGAVSGLAITAVTGSGTWQYSTDGTTWANFGAVSSTNALLITSSSQVRYIPAQNGETATFTYKAWDQTSGTASTNATPSYATTASSGGTTAFSTNNATAQITVTSVNDAPTITSSYTHTLTGTNEDTTSSGTLASAILTGANWADVDTGAVSGLAITGVTGNGTWQYSTDGTTWANFGAVSSTNALLITSSSQVRYIPNGQNGETATFTYKAWDQTSGTASTNPTPRYATTASSGGTTAFSTNNATAQITVTSVNDAPTITSGYTHILTGTNEDTTSSGTLASAILTGANWADVDTGAVSGLAITGVTGNGTWQYSTDGTTWNNFGAVSSTNALLIFSTSQVRYTSNAQNAETATFNFKAWDGTSGVGSTNTTPSYASTASSGGTTAFSTNNASASLSVTAVNDA
ncbi:MAG: hypothetical protein ACK5Z0_07560, partial [Planctomycetota bacterium]